MAIISVKMPSPEGVGAGQTATFKLPIGRKYHELQLSYSGMTLADMEEIRIFANAKIIHRYSGTERDAMNKFDRRNITPNILTIPFNRYGLRTRAGEEESALNTGGKLSAEEFANGAVAITSLYIEIDIGPGATSPVLSLHATQSEGQSGGAGSVLHVNRYVRDPSGAGEFDISDLPRGTATTIALNRIFFFESSAGGTIEALKIERNQYTTFERNRNLNEHLQKDGVRTPQNNLFVVDRTEHGYGGDPMGLVGIADLRYKLTMLGAETLRIYTETFGRLGD